MNDSTQQQEQTAGYKPGCACGGKGPFAHMLKSMMPSESVHEHFRNARIEFLKGFREMLDQRIENLSQHQSKGTKVNVE